MATTELDHVKLEEEDNRSMDELNQALAKVQKETMQMISSMININVDTLETIERQALCAAIGSRLG